MSQDNLTHRNYPLVSYLVFAPLLLATIPQMATAQAARSIRLVSDKSAGSIRMATFNVSFNRKGEGELTRDLQAGNAQISRIASIIRLVRPDVLLLNEVDYSGDVDNAAVFAEKYLAAKEIDGLGNPAWEMPYRYSGPVNTGLASGLDLNNDGKVGTPEDAWGFGAFPGQYGMAILSRYEMDRDRVRTFQNLPWSTMPGALEPRAPGAAPFYDPSTWKKLRLSSKSFWDVPIRTPLGVIRILASHPTPPAFDGPEKRNGCRNHDEIRLVNDYISPDKSAYIVDDRGQPGGIESGSAFVILGDLNSDPMDGGSRSGAVRSLLAKSSLSQFAAPQSRGAVNVARIQGKANALQRGPASQDTADFSDAVVGNLRVDYVLPSHHFRIAAADVFWPDANELPPEISGPVMDAISATDHRLVWVDVVRNY